jgi:hypothetical protein
VNVRTLPNYPGSRHRSIADKAIAQLAEATVRADRAEEAAANERARADSQRDQLEAMQVQLATAKAEAKAAHDRAWAVG